MDASLAKFEISPTLLKLLSHLSNEYFEESALPTLLIGNMITKVVGKKYPSLLVDLAVLVNKKETVEHLHEYGVVCSYDELKRFRSSSAFHASSMTGNSMRHHIEGLVQSVMENFDVNISSMNGLHQTHSLPRL